MVIACGQGCSNRRRGSIASPVRAGSTPKLAANRLKIPSIIGPRRRRIVGWASFVKENMMGSAHFTYFFRSRVMSKNPSEHGFDQ